MKILFVSLLVFMNLRAAQPIKLSQWVLDSWNMDSGLPQNTITSIEQTRDGYLWLATRAGIARFDGIRATLLDRSRLPGLGTNIVTKLKLDGDGNLWAAPLEAGLLRLDGTGWKRLGPELGLAKREIAELHLNRTGGIWAAPFRGGLLAWDGAKFSPLRTPKPLPASTILRVLHARDGSTWLGSAEHGLMHWQGENWQVYDKASGLSADGIWSITETSGGAILVGGKEGVDVIVNGKVRAGDRPAALAGKPIENALVMPDDETWWATYRHGLVRTKAEFAEQVRAPETLYDNEVRCLFRDREGSIWIGTQGGLNRLSPPRIEFYGEREGSLLSASSKIVIGEGGNVLGTDGEGNLLEGEIGSQKIVASHPGKDPNQELLGRSRDGTVWIRDSAKVLFTVQAGRYRKENFEAKGFLSSFLETASGEVWVGTRNGTLFRRTAQGWENVDSPFPNLKGAVTLMAEDSRGAIYVGTRNGLGILRNGQWKTWNKANGLPSELISALHVDDKGRAWAGTAAGIVRIDGEKLLRLDKANGLPDEAVTALAMDRNGDLWGGASSGLFRIRKTELEGLDQGQSIRLKVAVFGARDGLRQPEGRPFVPAWRAPDGSIWMVMMRGLACIRPSNLQAKTVLPETRIESVLVDGKSLAELNRIVIPATASRVEFQFTALSLERPERNRFRFRLLGYDKDWIDGGTQRSAVYTGLKGGDYRFEVIGANEDLVESPSASAISFEKSKSFTETPWFVLLILAVAAGTAILVARLRIRLIEEKHQLVLAERQRIACELHDTILQGFTGVTLQLEAIAKAGGPADKTGERIRNVLGHADQYLREARQAVWDLRAPAVATLFESLEACSKRLHGSIPVQCRMEGTARQLDASTERELILIAQEAITNAHRHSGASKILVDLSYSDKALHLSVQDDGRGFNTNISPLVNQGHFGLAGMKERAQKIGAELKISSGQLGTRVATTVRKDYQKLSQLDERAAAVQR